MQQFSKFCRNFSSFIFFFLVCILLSKNGYAQEGISIDTFKPSASSNSLFELTLPDTKGHLWWNLGGIVHYAQNPVKRKITVGNTEDTSYPVRLRLTGELFGSIALGSFLETGLVIPVVGYQTGEDEIQNSGIGDPRVNIKAHLLDYERFDGGVEVIATIPIGHYASSGSDFLGATGPTVEPRLLADFTFGPLILAANTGILIRPSSQIGDYEQKSALSWNAGMSYDIREFDDYKGLRVCAEINGEAGFNMDSFRETPLELLGGIKYRTPKDFVVSAGAGAGLSSAVGTPLFRIFVGISFDKIKHSCDAGPEDFDGFQDDDQCIDPDNDGDGFLDAEDKCPNIAEDKDNYRDQDGCPDMDNDGDGVPDLLDKCPMLAEDMDNYEDDDGCPEEGPGKPTVKITDTQLLLSSKIYFDYNKTSVKPVSYPILNEVARALKNNAYISKIRVEGHTDNEGTAEYNIQLSEQRAKSVVDYLNSQGIEKERLEFKGFGFSVPKASNATEVGRAINRRVEFTIIRKE